MSKALVWEDWMYEIDVRGIGHGIFNVELDFMGAVLRKTRRGPRRQRYVYQLGHIGCNIRGHWTDWIWGLTREPLAWAYRTRIIRRRHTIVLACPTCHRQKDLLGVCWFWSKMSEALAWEIPNVSPGVRGTGLAKLNVELNVMSISLGLLTRVSMAEVLAWS